jgi:hypothetical protein
LLALAVAQPVDTPDKRAAGPSQAPEASWIYKYGAKKPSQIGTANWIAQVSKRVHKEMSAYDCR